MWVSDTAVKRPVAALVLSLLLCVFGFVSLQQLAVRELPDIDSPVVTVSTRYDGASATVIETQVTSAIEEQLVGIDGVDDISSTTRNGSSRITITFNLDYNLDSGVSDVRDAVARARRSLPEGIDEPLVYKDNGSGEASIYVNLSSTSLDRVQLTDYTERVLIDKFNLLPGVSSVVVTGGLYKVLYVKLDPIRMAGRGVTVQDISAALRSENLAHPGGEIRNDALTMSVRMAKNYPLPADFDYLVVKRSQRAGVVYLKDVADVYVGAENETSLFKSDGEMNISLGIVAQSNANPLQVAERVREQVKRIIPTLPQDTALKVDYDSTVFIERSIKEVFNTLLITGALVVVVLFLFIGQVKATLIPAVTVPVSLISAFIVAYTNGYSINLITLMALILAIGLVVDDAIVVVENIYHHIQQGAPVLLAAYKGTREVGFAVIATTLVLVMVFLPISFMDGMVGRLFTEFSVMLAVSVIFSSVIALTLTPVLSSHLLKSAEKPSAVSRMINAIFDGLERGYRHVLKITMRLRLLAPFVVIGCIAGAYFLISHVPKQLAPVEDRGVIFSFIRGADATSYNRMANNMDLVEQRLLPLVGKGVIKSFSMQSPAFGGNAGDQTGFVIIMLEDWEHRDVSANQALAQVRKALKNIPDVRVRPFLPGMRRGSQDPLQVVLSGVDYPTLKQWTDKLDDALQKANLIEGSSINYSEKVPELVVSIDKDKAAELGISAETVAQTLEVMLGGSKVTTYEEQGHEYDVYLRGDEARFNSAADLSQIYLRTRNGQLITLDAVTRVDEVASAIRLSHNSKKKSITLSGGLPKGIVLGDAITQVQQIANEMLPAEISLSFSGESKDYLENESGMWQIFALALLVAYLVLAAQFESFINPLVIMFTVPMGILGGGIGLWLMDQTLNIYSQIGLIMLIGMVTKNGILIVEFANQLRDQGMAFEEAIINAAARRLRPILMTAFTTLVGSVPLIISTGAGYESRISVGTTLFFGMAFATLVTLLVIPAMYRILARYTQPPGHHAAKLFAQQQSDVKGRKQH